MDPTRRRLAENAPRTVARVDSTGLRYTVSDGHLYVSYPHRGDGHVVYGAGLAIGPVPTTYWTDPPNAITSERATLWAALIAGDGAPP